jgi:DNA methyltransferase 1-associated protein 1
LDDEYPFAKFNKTLRRLKYTDAEYEAHLCHPVWTREATDHLFALADQYSLRWVVIADRFDRTRFPNIEATVEDCKQRYYDSFNVLAVAAAAGTEPTLIHYDADHNRRRKVQLEHLWRRTQVEIDEENELLVQLKHIETRKRERERKAADLQKLIAAAERAPLSPAPVAIAGVCARRVTRLFVSHLQRPHRY